MRAQPHFKLTRQATLALLMSAAFSAAAEAAPVARIEFTSGPVTTAGPGAKPRVVGKGSVLEGGETIETGVNGRAQLRFTDGAYMSLQPQTAFRVDDYRWDGQTDGSEKGFFSLLKGGLRTITGAIGRSNRSTYQVTTATATIGIRGTEYLLQATNSDTLHVGGGEGVLRTKEPVPRTFLVRERSTIFLADPKAAPVYTQPPILPPAPAEVPARQGSQPAAPPGQTESQQTNTPTPAPPAPQTALIAGNQTTSSGSALIVGAGGGAAPALPVIPLANGPGGVAIAAVDSAGAFSAGLLGGTLTFNAAGALTQTIDCCTPVNNFTAGVSPDFGADGIIAWGRWTSGVRGGQTPQLTVNYAAGLSANAVIATSIVRGYISFASSAPTVTSGGTLVATGSPNSVTGTMTVNFPSLTGGGSLSYALSIPVAGQTFSINGSANQFVGTAFLGTTSTIASTGAGCTPSCTGNIPFGNAIQGFFTGASAQRAGANYGFTSQIGQVTGAVVMK